MLRYVVVVVLRYSQPLDGRPTTNGGRIILGRVLGTLRSATRQHCSKLIVRLETTADRFLKIQHFQRRDKF